MSSKLKIFLSHKHTDRHKASEIKRLIEEDVENLEIFVSQQIERGSEWLPRVYDELRDAKWLILLYTDPNHEWDWCLYEAGFFAAHENQDKTRRLICLFPPDIDAPSPLQGWQFVPASDPSGDQDHHLIDFLKDLYKSSPSIGEPPIAAKRATNDEKLRTIAKGLSDVIGPGPGSILVHRYLSHATLTLTHGMVESLRETGTIPNDAEVEMSDSALNLLGLDVKVGQSWKWREVLSQFQLEPPKWVECFGRAMRAAESRVGFAKVLPVFASPFDNRKYVPVFDQYQLLNNNKRKFTLVFVEESGEDDPRPTSNTGTIGMLLMMAIRFRWGVLIPYINKLRQGGGGWNEKLVVETLDNLRSAIDKVLGEAAEAGYLAQEVVMEAFDTNEDRSAIAEMFARWYPIQQQLFESIQSRNSGQVLVLLEKVFELNRHFMVLTSKRHYELLNPGGLAQQRWAA
jgi:hypothetical protein